VLALSGCGRVAFERLDDAAVDAPSPPNGVLDPAFGNGGIAIVTHPTATSFKAYDVGRSANGYAVLASRVDGPGRPVLAGFTAAGQVDTSFGMNGQVVVGSTMSDFGYGILATENRLLITGDGYVDDVERDQIIVTALDLTGVLDTGFGMNGYYRFGPASNDSSKQIRFSATGYVVTGVQGYDLPDSLVQTVVVRFNGTTQQAASLNLFPGQQEFSFDLLVENDGVVIVGYSLGPAGGMFAVKLSAPAYANQDPAWATNGLYARTDGTQAHAIVPLANGDFALVGDDAMHSIVVILSPDGQERAVHAGSFGDTEQLWGASLVNGGFMAAGTITRGTEQNGLLLRYRYDGTLDPTFGDGGVLEIDAGGADVFRAVKTEVDGSLIVTGYSTLAGSDRIMLLKVK
jgi:hypothetical protein